MKKKTEKPAQAAAADLKEVKRLLDFMAEHGLEEFEYDSGGFRVRLKKPSALHWVSAAPASAGQAPLAASTAGQESALQASPAAGRPAEDLHIIKSPIVGTFYEGSAPGAEPFVKAGSQVTAGQTLCIIEAMKLMNEIESDVSGEVVEIKVANGQPVEYGEPLFAIRTKK